MVQNSIAEAGPEKLVCPFQTGNVPIIVKLSMYILVVSYAQAAAIPCFYSLAK